MSQYYGHKIFKQLKICLGNKHMIIYANSARLHCSISNCGAAEIIIYYMCGQFLPVRNQIERSSQIGSILRCLRAPLF